MLTIRKSDERGRSQAIWLDSRHTFSFGEYRDPVFVQFGALRVINEDRIAGGGGFGEHPHRDMEIVTYILEGELRHRDSTGGVGTIAAGEIQRMSAGSGIVHSEINASADRSCHLLQIWIMPSKFGLTPSFEQKKIDPKAVENRFARIVAANPRENEMRIVQDAEIWVGKLDADHELFKTIESGRRAWLQVAKGEVILNETVLLAGDGVAVTDEDKFLLRAKRPSELVLFDLA